MSQRAPAIPILPPALSAKLSALGGQLEHGRPDLELAEALADLSMLPADKIVRASNEIARAARLDGWPSGKVERAHVTRQPDYAWLLLFHPNGFVREAALDAINDPPTSPFWFAALAWRLNDWAVPVRRAAERCAERVLHRAAIDIATHAALHLLDRCLSWGRWRDEPAILDQVFERPEVVAAVADQLAEQRNGRLATYLRHL